MTPFDGETYDRDQDGPRLTTALERIRHASMDGKWRTLAEWARIGQCSEAAASARLRDLRKEKFGGLTVERRRVEGRPGVWEYRVLWPARKGQQEFF